MTHDERMLVLSAKADEIASCGGFHGIMVVATWVDPKDGGTCVGDCIRGNSHAAIGAAEEVIGKHKSYDHGYHAENGRYDAVVSRQRKHPTK